MLLLTSGDGLLVGGNKSVVDYGGRGCPRVTALSRRPVLSLTWELRGVLGRRVPYWVDVGAEREV